jgi:HSP20 family protein
MAEQTTLPVKRADGKTRMLRPLGLLDDLEAEFDRFWRRPWSFRPGSWVDPFRVFAREAYPWAPRMDVYEKDNTIVIKAELPGLKKEDVQVEIQGDDLVIRGESKAESEVKEEDYYRSERTFGSFYRRMPLPTGVTAEQIQATLTEGVLEVTMPKAAESKPEAKKITVK